ncbi:MAG: TSUP family transporter [Crocinitomix sp.]|nr:TSUP family transporter [Crocinitomix sp.]
MLEISAHIIIILSILFFLGFTLGSTLGFGSPLVIIPALMLFFEPKEAIALIVPAMLINNLAKLWLFKKSIDVKSAFRMGVTALPLAFLASFFTESVHPLVLKLFVTIVLLYVVINRLISKRFEPKGSAIFWGIPTGIISGLSGTAGPFMLIGMRKQRLTLTHFVATVALLQTALQIIRIPGYLATEILSTNLIWLSLFLALFTIPSVFLSRAILKLLNPAQFEKALDIFLIAILIFMLINFI